MNLRASNPLPIDLSQFWSRLLRYYRACVIHESGFAELLQRASTRERYVFLPAGPEPLLSDPDGAVVVDPSIRGLASRAIGRGETLCYGYPVLLFHESGSAGVRRKLAPLFVYELALPEKGQPFPLALGPRSDEPFLYGGAMSRLGYKDEQQAALIDAVAFDEWRGDAETFRENINEILSALGIRCAGKLDPARLLGVGEGQIDGVGAHNVAMVFRTTRAEYSGRLIEELQVLERLWPEVQRTAAAFLLGPPTNSYFAAPKAGAGTKKNIVGGATAPDLAIPIPLNDAQQAALRDALNEPLTVVTGPPGTGKSQLVTSIISSAWLSGQSVLVASTNNQAVDVACARSQELWPGLVVRTGSKDYRESSKQLLLGLVKDRVLSPDLRALKTCFVASGKRSRAAIMAVDQRTEWEERLVAVQLGREKVAGMIGINIQSFGAQHDDRSVRSLERALSRLAAGRGFFRPWRLRRLSSRLGSDLCIHMAETLEFVTLEREWRQLRLALEGELQFNEQWRRLVSAQREFQTTSADLVRAKAQVSFQQGSNAIRRYASAQPRYGVPGGPSEVFPSALTYVRAWASTALSVAATIPLRAALFDLVVIDEASQCSVPAILPLLFRARRAVVIGDQMQLAHITSVRRKDEEARLSALDLDPQTITDARLSYQRDSVFRALEKSAPYVRLLDEHYRSHPEIIEISNRLFYHGNLTVLTDPQRLLQVGLPAVSWRDMRGRAMRPEGGSAVNHPEAHAVVSAVVELARRPEFSGSVGVVTPFSAQSRMITGALESALSLDDRQRIQLGVGTAHRFQGDERDIMVFSPVVAEGLPPHSVGWLVGSPNLFNVAITRARSALLIIGDQNFCAGLEGPIGYLARYIKDRPVGPDLPDLHSEAEARLFKALCRLGVDVKTKMRVQGYEADFIIQAGSTIINLECDGRHHEGGAGHLRRQDRARDALIEAMGLRVLRVPAWRCLADPEAVAKQLMDECKIQDPRTELSQQPSEPES